MFKFFHKDPVKEWEPVVERINKFESEFEGFSDEQLKAKTEEFRKKLAGGESLDEVLPHAFAAVREAAKRTLKQRHFDVQLLGGIALHKGMIAEMATGEGKTLTATLPAYLNALPGKGVHIVTVNDYLASRDTVWMGQIYRALGLSVACLVHEGAYQYDPQYQMSADELKNEALRMKSLDEERDVLGAFKVVHDFLRPIGRGEAYQSDILYGTNHEFGFDYLRDHLATIPDQVMQRSPDGAGSTSLAAGLGLLNFAIVDEVDSILIDEARTPLIISSVDQESSAHYKTFDRIAKIFQPNVDFEIDEKRKAIQMLEPGLDKLERRLGFNPYEIHDSNAVHHLEEALRANFIYQRDKDYVVRQGKVIIVDEFTGRLMFGRRWSGGLHQAVEAKENVSIEPESKTVASITIQNLFRKYKKLAGMTGTAATSAEEFHKVYGLEVAVVPPNKPSARKDLPDQIFVNQQAKWNAVVKTIKRLQAEGRPVLIGTTSIEKNEHLSRLLQEAGVRYQMLNAKNHEQEGMVIAQAGKVGATTVATNMAGRGVDILLGGNPPDPQEAEKVKELGGLFVLGTERHEARRIDNQLRGRTGRQGDPGETQFFLSLDDDLLRIFGGETIQKVAKNFNLPEDQPLEHSLISKTIESAQAKVEGINFDIRKHLLEYDDVLNRQREKIYHERQRILFGEVDPQQLVRETAEKFFESRPEASSLRWIFQLAEGRQEQEGKGDEVPHEVSEQLLREAKEKFEAHFQKLKEEVKGELSALLRITMLRIYDYLWSEHLDYLEGLRESVSLRGYGQKDPLVEYRREALQAFEDFDRLVNLHLLSTVMRFQKSDAAQMKTAPRTASGEKVGRNDPCPCGAQHPDGRPIKYKHCHGRN